MKIIVLILGVFLLQACGQSAENSVEKTEEKNLETLISDQQQKALDQAKQLEESVQKMQEERAKAMDETEL